MINHLSKNALIYSALIIILSVLGYAGVIIKLTWPIDVYSVDKAGVFGDSFGVITCLFTALGFLGVLINLREQRRTSIKQQQNLEKQQESIEKQNFENTFFQMLNHLNEITKDVDFTISNLNNHSIKFYGRSAFDELSGQLRSIYQATSEGNNFPLSELDKTEKAYNKFWGLYSSKLGHYFRWIYNILNYIQTNNEADKEFYVKLVLAQLSNQELMLLFYNSCFKRGLNFIIYIRRYEMMSNLESRELIIPSHKELIPGVKFYDGV